MNLDPTKLHHGLVEKGTEMARTRAYATTTDRLRKQVRAGCVIQYLNAGATLGKAQEAALLEAVYITACERAEAAEQAAGVADVEYEAAQAWFRAWQTIESTERAKMTMR